MPDYSALVYLKVGYKVSATDCHGLQEFIHLCKRRFETDQGRYKSEPDTAKLNWDTTHRYSEYLGIEQNSILEMHGEPVVMSDDLKAFEKEV
jgi:hypothetical protein